MNISPESLLLRARLVEACLDLHQDAFADNPGFRAQREEFRRLLGRAVEADGGAEPDQAREALARAVRIASGPLESWAAVIGDEPLRLLAGSCPEGWTLRGAGLAEHARALVAAGREALGQGAAGFGLTEALLEDVEARMAAVEAEVERGAVREVEAFRRAVLDPLVRLYLDRAPGFCAAYRTACREVAGKPGRQATGRGREEVAAGEMLSA
jgi:hypothetical protein